MLTLVKENKNEVNCTYSSNTKQYSNIVSFASKAKSNSNNKSQKNVLAAAKKIKW
ncbi:MAG: hypothetical protein ACI88H_000206 [Cocleimonas sp.]|jgi:hypothetical protein